MADIAACRSNHQRGKEVAIVKSVVSPYLKYFCHGCTQCDRKQCVTMIDHTFKQLSCHQRNQGREE